MRRADGEKVTTAAELLLRSSAARTRALRQAGDVEVMGNAGRGGRESCGRGAVVAE